MIEDNNFFWPETISTSFFKCIKAIKSVSNDFSDWVKNYVPGIISYLKKEMIDLIDDDDDEHTLMAGLSTESGIEIYAISKLENWTINCISLDSNCCKINEQQYIVESRQISANFKN